MRKLSVILLLILVIFSSCKKEEKIKIAINATSYLEDDRVYSNIAFIRANQKQIVQSKEAVDAYFDTAFEHGQLFTQQYSKDMAPGSYIILIQIVDPLARSKRGTYTYREVTISEGNPSMENVMLFKYDLEGFYQPWNNKY